MPCVFKKWTIEIKRFHLAPSVCNFGCVILAGTWHTVEVIESSVIYETKVAARRLMNLLQKRITLKIPKHCQLSTYWKY
ncbi:MULTISPECIES: DUF6016 domain-containing protein [Bacteroidales]|uniref:DUF6016 domain-containing protein n=1 Tax=Bacteroidales TaxID=171549 RepID=UPI001C6FDA67|nr:MULTISPECIES: DUF6016 domain-containing protein [Alistipes]